MRFLLTALCLSLSLSLPALQPEKAPATMDSVRQAWTLLGWDDAKQARRWFETATESSDPVTAYYGWEGIADCNARLGHDPSSVMKDYLKAQRYIKEQVLDDGLSKRLHERMAGYQQAVITAARPTGKWSGPAGRRALQKIADGYGDADKGLRLDAWETLGDRAFEGRHPSKHAAEAAYHAWSMALNQDPDKIERVRLERKLGDAEKLLPGYKDKGETKIDQSGVVVDPAFLALMTRCGQCGGKGGRQRRACAEVAKVYTELYGPSAEKPQKAKVVKKVKALELKLTDSGCF